MPTRKTDEPTHKAHKDDEVEVIESKVEHKKAKRANIIHEYNGNNHRIVIGDRVGAWASYAAIAELDNFRASSDDRGEAMWQIHSISHLDYEVVRDKKE